MTRTNFSYDPKRQGYDDVSLWKTLTGVPTVVSDKIVLSEAEIVNYGDLYGCDLSMRLILPAAPHADDVREFGLANVALGAYIVFRISDEKMYIKAFDGLGNEKTEEVEFVSAWVNDPIDFEIRWRGTYADFLVNGIRVLPLYRINDIAIPKNPLSIYFNNENADNMEIVSINARNIQTFI